MCCNSEFPTLWPSSDRLGKQDFYFTIMNQFFILMFLIKKKLDADHQLWLNVAGL